MNTPEMNILYLIGSLGNGGKEQLVRDVMKMGKELPYKAWCVCRKKPAEGPNTILLPSGKVIRFLHQLRKIVRSNNIDLIHAQSAFDALLARLATVGLGTPVVETFHSYEFATNPRSKSMERLAFALCAKSVFVSQQQLEHFAAVHHLSPKQRKKQALVYNGVNFSRFPLTEHKPDHRLRMAMVGNFVPEKNQLFILNFLEQLNTKGIDFEFLFIGEKKSQFATYYDRCVQYCKEKGLDDRVHFLGKRDDVPQLLGQLDAFVYSSHSETFGLAVVEAIAVGVPVFVNDLPVFKEITQGGQLATLYATGDLQQLSDKFEHFLHHQTETLATAAENAYRVRNTYSIKTHVANLNSLYSLIITKQ